MNGEVANVINYFGVNCVWKLLAINPVARSMVVPILNDVSQIPGAIPIARSAIVGLMYRTGHPFKVIAEGGGRSHMLHVDPIGGVLRATAVRKWLQITNQ